MKPTFPPDLFVGLRLGRDKSDIRKALRQFSGPRENRADVICRALRRGLGLPQPGQTSPIMDDKDAFTGGAK